VNWAPRILQFGATGQVARELRARDRNSVITALSRDQVDLRNPQAIADAIAGADVDLVVNAAAYTAVDRAESEEDLAFAVNAVATGAMAEACARRSLPFVHLSTDYVFDGDKDGPWREDDPIGPINAYGRTKAAGEAAVAQSGARALIIRTSWVFSPFGSNFVKTMLAAARVRDELRIVDDQHGRPTAASEIAEFVFAVAPALTSAVGDASAGVFHFAGDGATTWRGLAEAIFDLGAGPRPRITPIATAQYPTSARRPLNSVLDCGKIERVLGVAPRPWREGLAETLAKLGAEANA
jgi:dTDP-4-dehydrorhamnose reductase